MKPDFVHCMSRRKSENEQKQRVEEKSHSSGYVTKGYLLSVAARAGLRDHYDRGKIVRKWKRQLLPRRA